MLTDNILQLHPLQVVPDPLIRVQLGSIGGQLLQMDSLPSRAGQEGFDRLAAVDGAAIPDDQQPHRDVGGQLLQEPRRIYTPEGPVLDPSVQPALGGDATDYRQMVPAEGCPEHWSLASGGIGLDHHGQQVATRFVHEDDGPAFIPGLFLSAGQRFSFQCRMASSSRCCARRLGFWRVHPYCLRMRPTWEGWYLTRKWRRMTWATLGWVQTSPRKPKADGPWASSSSSWSRCWWANLGWRPGGLQWRRAWGPWVLVRLSHWLTAPLLTPKASAMRCWGQPSWDSSQARSRRPSRQLVACWELSPVIPSSMPVLHSDV
jgi:hypothetical protein